MRLQLLTQNIEKYTTTEELKTNVLSALYNFGAEDLDFNGENGKDYLWMASLTQGYENNRDYLINKVSTFDDINTMVYKYLEEWIGNDSYYDTYDYNIIRNGANEIVAIALAYGIED